MLINNPVITGSFTVNGVNVAGITGSSELSSSYLALSASFLTTSASYASASGSLSTRVTNLEATSSTVSSSFVTTSGSIAGRVTLIEGQYATTGSNNFTAPQRISDVSNAISFTSTASIYTDGGLRVKGSSFVSGTAYFNNITVYGTSSIQYVTSSQLAIGTNIITLNTDTPSVRFGGISVFDSGSNNLSTGSLFWDSEKDRWVYANPSGSSYDGGMIISGPRNTSGLGNEQGTLSNYVMKGQGGDHITSSQIIDDGTTVRIPGNLQITGSTILSSALTGTSAAFSGNLTLGSTATGINANIYASSYGNNGLFQAFGTDGNLKLQMGGLGSTEAYLYTGAGNKITFFSGGSTTLTLASNQTATFASSVTAGGTISIGNFDGLALKMQAGTSTGTSYLRFYNSAGNTKGYFGLFNSGGTDYTLLDGSNTDVTINGNSNLYLQTGGANRLTIASTGAATFANNVSASAFLASNYNLMGEYYNESSFYLLNFPDATANQCVDIRLGNGFLNGWLEIEITGGYVNQNTTGILRAVISFGLNPNNSQWQPPIMRIAEAQGPVVDNICIGNIEWDSSTSQYRIPIFHTVSSGNDYTIHINHHKMGGTNVAASYTLSSVYTRSAPSPSRQFVYYNERVGVGTNNPLCLIQAGGIGNTITRLGTSSASNTSSHYSFAAWNSSGGDILTVRGDGLVALAKINDFTTGNSPNTWINPNSSWGIYINTSSIRYKKDIVNYDRGISTVNQLRPVYYKGKSDVDGDKQFAGFIAEEIDELGLTEFVQYNEEGLPNSLAYPNMITLAIKAIQEQQIQIEELKAEINELKNK